MSDIISRVLSHAPVDTRYIGGLWHPGRVSLRGIWTEARVLGASLTAPVNRDVGKFLIISRARSGSTLLTQLLNTHPQVRCDREVLAKRVLFPRAYLNRLAHKNTAAAYGAKLLSYQMVQVQRFRDPAGFLARLEQDGFRFIHLQRDTFAQTVSLAMAQSRRFFHQKTDPGAGVGKHIPEAEAKKARAPVQVDVEDFIRRLEWNDMLLEYEHYCLRALPHLVMSYEEGLQDPQTQQQAADRGFDWIGVPSAPVRGGLKKTLPPDPTAMIANYDALATRMRLLGFDRLLPA